MSRPRQPDPKADLDATAHLVPVPDFGPGDEPRHYFRINAWAAGLVAASLAAVGLAYLVGSAWQERRVGGQVLLDAKAQEKSGNVDLAIRNLRRFLDAHPTDVAPLEELARIVAASARSADEALEAAKVNDRLLRIDPGGPGRQETRRRLVELYVRCGDEHRASAVYRLAPETASHELRYRAARAIAQDLMDPKFRGGRPVEPRDHGLLAMALEGLAVPGDNASLIASVAEYQKAMDGAPGDSAIAERLARICLERLNDPARGERVLDALTAARPGSHEPRLIRYRYFTRARRPDRALAELEEATRLAPGDFEVRLTAASDALGRGDAPAGRRHLAAVPEAFRDNLRLKVMRGMVDFSEERPDQAIDGWRQGLLTIGGTDANLTWWLAHALLQMGRVAEARPLVAQYRRLAGADDQPLHRFLLAELEEKTGRPRRAILSLEWARDRIGDYWQAMIQMALGRCHEALWDEPRALAAYRRASQVDPRMAEPRIAAARLLALKPDQAAVELERGLSQTPDDPALRIAMVSARLRQQLGRPAAGRDWADFDRAMAKALESTPKNSALLLMQADRVGTSGDLAAAVRILERGVVDSPKNPWLWTALADGQARLGGLADGLRTLDRASGPGAAGDRALIRVARARVMLASNRGREAREQLIRDDRKLAQGDRPLVWEALGRIDAARGEVATARAAFEQWARLLPDDPRPRLALLELAQSTGDEAAVRAAVESVRDLGGVDDVAYRLCRAQELLWSGTATNQPISRRDPRLEEAARLLEDVLVDAPEVPAAHLIRGQVLERLDRVDDAIVAYRRAWDRGAAAALPRLVELLTRRRRFEELAALRTSAPAVQLDRLSAQASFRAGDYDSAGRYAEKAALDDAGSAGSRTWQARMLELIGKPDEAEAALRSLAEQTPAEIAPWLALVRSLASHGKAGDVARAIDRARGAIKDEDARLVEARLRWAGDDPAAAEAAFSAAIRARPDASEPRLYASLFFEATGRPAEAIACLRRMRGIDPKGRGPTRQLAVLLANDPATWEQAATTIGPEGSADEPPDDRLARALVYSRAPDAERRARAIGILESLVADLPLGGDLVNRARTLLVRLLLRAGQAEKASLVAVVLAAPGSDTEGLSLFIEALLRSGKRDEAIRQIDRLAALTPGDPAEVGFRLRWLRESTRPAELPAALERSARERWKGPGGEAFARAAFAALVDLGPDAYDRADRVARLVAESMPSAGWMTAKVAARRGRQAEAVGQLMAPATSSIVDDRRGAARVALEISADPGAGPAAISGVGQVLESALAKDPADPAVLVAIATFRHQQARYDDEAGLLRRALAARPGDPVASNNLAWALSECLNRPDQALPVIDEEIRTNGRADWTLDTRGVILTRLGRLDEAIATLKEAGGDRPSAATLYHLARAYRRAGRAREFRDAIDLARRAGLSPRELDPVERAEMDKIMAPDSSAIGPG